MATRAKPGRSKRRFDSPKQEAWLNLWRTYDRLRLLEEELFAAHGLTPQQYNALRLLLGEHPRAMATLALASRLVSKSPDITRLIDKLVERGLVKRERAADNRRVVRLGITAAGIELLKGLETPVRKCHERQLGHLSAAELNDLIRLLRRARRPHEEQAGHWSTGDER